MHRLCYNRRLNSLHQACDVSMSQVSNVLLKGTSGVRGKLSVSKVSNVSLGPLM